MTYYVYNYTSLSDWRSSDDYTDLKVLTNKIKNFIHIYGSLGSPDTLFTDVFTLVKTFETEEDAWDYIMSIPMKHKFMLKEYNTVRFDGILTE